MRKSYNIIGGFRMLKHCVRIFVFIIFILRIACADENNGRLLKCETTEDAKTCMELGFAKTRDKNYQDALLYFEQAYTYKQSEGCVFAGIIHHNDGKNGAKGSLQALEFFKKACAANNGKGCLFSGLSYSTHAGIPKDLIKALTFFKTACDLKEGEACFNIAAIYESGKEIARNLDQALIYYQKA